MIRLEWNALRLGNRVLVHDDNGRDMSLVAGVIAMVGPSHGAHDIGVRIPLADGGSRIMRPTRLAVHLEQFDPTEQCWRCAVNTARAGSRTVPTPPPDPRD